MRWASLFLLLAGLGAIWATELSAVVVSLLAVAVAIVLATKELILCISGARGQGMPSFSTEPRIVMRTREGGKLEFVLRIPVPARDKGHAEQEILRGFLGAAPV